jgi:hypothetical protein
VAKQQSKKRTSTLPIAFTDDDLKTPVHDEIMLWLDANAERLLGAIQDHRHEIAVHYHGLEVGHTVTTCVRFEVVKKEWQKPIDVNKIATGYVDMYIKYRAFPQEWETFEFEDRFKRPEIDLAKCTPQDEIHFLQPFVGFEVKSSIASLGELIRQIRTYQIKFKGVPFHVVSPDDRFATILEEQGIGFIKYPGMQA